MKSGKDGTMPVLDHLAELRLRLFISAGALLAAVVFCFAHVELIRSVLTNPLAGIELIYLSPPEAFVANLRLALISGFILSSPVLIYEAGAFIFPGLYGPEKLLFILVIIGSVFLFSGGVVFAYYVVLPYTLRFFLQFAAEQVDPRFTISEFISFIFSFHLAFGVVFQLPLLTWALGKIGLLSSAFLRRNRKIALLIMLVLSAIITPPDIVSQVAIVLPLIVLYEIGILMVVVSEKKRLKVMAE